MLLEMGVVLGIAVPTFGGIVWGIRLEGRVNGHDTLFIEREKRAEASETNVKQWLDQHETHDAERHADLKSDLRDIKESLHAR